MTLELGGKSANIVFDDANLDNAVKGAVSGIFAATGQTCIAGSRLLVQRTVHDAFMEKLLALAKTARMGDPLDDATQVGPITTRPQAREGAGLYPDRQGRGRHLRPRRRAGLAARMRPGLVRGADHLHRRDAHMRIAQEEVFGRCCR